MIEDKKEETVYQRLAEAELQNRLLSDRLTMMTRMCNDYIDMRADLCRRLERFDLAVAINNQVIRKPSK